MMKAPIEYHSSAKLKIDRRPKRSDSHENAMVPMNRPRNSGDKTGKALQIEQALRCRLENTGLEKADRHLGGEEQIVEFEPAAERQQRHQPAGVAGGRQAIESRRNSDCRIRRQIRRHVMPPAA